MLKAVSGGGGAASGITIGTSVITGGTNKRILFDDNGVIGENAALVFDKTLGQVGLTGASTTGVPAIFINKNSNLGAGIVFSKSSNSGANPAFAVETIGSGLRAMIDNQGTLWSNANLVISGSFAGTVAADGTVVVTNFGITTPAPSDSTGFTYIIADQAIALVMKSFNSTDPSYLIQGFDKSNNWIFNITGETGQHNWGVGATLGSMDLSLGRKAAAHLRQGGPDVASPIAQKFSIPSIVAGTTDAAGVDWTFTGSASTGTGAAGGLSFEVGASASGTGNTVNTPTQVLYLGSTGTTPFAKFLVPVSSSGVAISANVTSITGIAQLMLASNNGATNGVMNLIDYGGTAFGTRLTAFKTRASTTAASTIVQSGDDIFSLAGYGADGSAYRQAGYLKLIVDGTPGASDMPGRWVFATTPDGSATPAIAMTLDNHQNTVLNNAAIAANATDGFLYIASGAGPPTGTPTAFTGRVPLYFDSTNDQLYIYRTTWKQPKTPAGAAIVTWQ